MTAESSHAYHQNPNMTTALALIEQALSNNLTRKIEHTSAHDLDKELEKQHVRIKPSWRETTNTYVVYSQIINNIRNLVEGIDHHMDDLVMLNAMADWGAKHLTIHGNTDGQHLQKPALIPGKYMFTTPSGDIQRADESHLRKSVAKHIRRQLVEEILAKRPGKYAIKGKTAALWENESNYMLARSSWPEQLNFMLQCILGSIRYNADLAKVTSL